MSEFLKLAFEMIAQIIYYLAEVFVGFFGGLLKLFITGWPTYIAIFKTYFPEMNFFVKILALLLMLILIAIPVGLIYLLIRHIQLNRELRADDNDNTVLYKEIGRLNHQVLELMDEKSKILNLKVDAMGGSPYVGGLALNQDGIAFQAVGGEPAYSTPINTVPGASATSMAVTNVNVAGGAAGGLVDPLSDDAVIAPAGAAPMVAAAPVVGGISAGEDAVASAAIAAATAAAQARKKADEEEHSTAIRFPKLSMVDAKYEDFEFPEYDDTITLQQLAKNYRLFAASQMHLYYTPEIVRRFIAGLAASKILILEGISGTGKTSLPYSFSRFLDNQATMISVQPSYRDRTELLGYFNEFSKRFNETEFLRALYEASYRLDPSFIVLDEMNLARIEYYFAEMLSVLELPSKDEWLLDLVPTAWPGDPMKMDSGKVKISPSLWFIGTANSDDSTFTITDKVYDRAMPIELNERAEAFTCELQPRCCITYEHLMELFAKAKEDHPITDATLAKMVKLDQYLQTRFKLAFGNRIMKQMYEFIPVYVACGGTEIDGLDYIVARKVLKKFESMNVSFVRDEIKGLIAYIEKTFGKTNMNDSRAYLERIQNLY